ncbi:MAG: hypothetical protein Q8M02_01875 [Candidatus Didemnitutus sp.]|nr:hypothetical protein [Candidatus Didemnitutus sp.]
MEEIIRFVTLANSGRFTVTKLCEQFGISHGGNDERGGLPG